MDCSANTIVCRSTAALIAMFSKCGYQRKAAGRLVLSKCKGRCSDCHLPPVKPDPMHHASSTNMHSHIHCHTAPNPHCSGRFRPPPALNHHFNVSDSEIFRWRHKSDSEAPLSLCDLKAKEHLSLSWQSKVAKWDICHREKRRMIISMLEPDRLSHSTCYN